MSAGDLAPVHGREVGALRHRRLRAAATALRLTECVALRRKFVSDCLPRDADSRSPSFFGVDVGQQIDGRALLRRTW